MKVYFNTMVKNEAVLLDNILPIWKNYPVDKFIFLNDNSDDNTAEIIEKHLEKERYKIINNKTEEFHESRNRAKMLQYSRIEEADFVLSIDSDELLSANLSKELIYFLKNYDSNDIWLYWYNVIDSLEKTRNDPYYQTAFRSFILPLKNTEEFNLNNWKYHTPRVPEVNLPKKFTKDYGVIHLQSINKKFYALKQLWYKHYEYVKYKHSVYDINEKYDLVVNNLNFCEVKTPQKIIEGIDFRPEIFNKILDLKEYKKFILDNYNKDLVTFGKEFLQ